jgi:hypothetical protein
MFLRQSTNSQRVSLGHFLSAADGDTAMTALVIAGTDIKLHKLGASVLANAVTGAVHMVSGVYYWTAQSGDTDTVGLLAAYVHPSGALAVKSVFVVLPPTIYDAFVAGTKWLPVDAFKPNWAVSGGALTVKDPDNTTTSYTKAIAADASAQPIVGAT